MRHVDVGELSKLLATLVPESLVRVEGRELVVRDSDGLVEELVEELDQEFVTAFQLEVSAVGMARETLGRLGQWVCGVKRWPGPMDLYVYDLPRSRFSLEERLDDLASQGLARLYAHEECEVAVVVEAGHPAAAGSLPVGHFAPGP